MPERSSLTQVVCVRYRVGVEPPEMRSQRMPAAREGVARLAQQRIDSIGAGCGRWPVTPAVARVAADAGHLDRGQRGELLRHPDGARRRRLAGAVEADVELDQQLRGGAAPSERTREILGRGATQSTATVSSTPAAAIRASRSHFRRRRAGSARGAAARPPPANTCASPVFATVRPPAPSSSWRLPDLRRLVRLRVRPELDPVRVGVDCSRERFASSRSRSTQATGVSTSASGRPTCSASSASVRSDADVTARPPREASP